MSTALKYKKKHRLNDYDSPVALQSDSFKSPCQSPQELYIPWAGEITTTRH